jgi:hypothetical protein
MVGEPEDSQLGWNKFPTNLKQLWSAGCRFWVD